MNPLVRAEPAWSPPELRALAVRSCFDCHSNKTRWRWYSQVAPISWVAQRHTAAQSTSEYIAPMSKLSFSHWTDPLCIWAFVAQDQLDRLLAEHAQRLAIDSRVVPIFGSIAWRFTHGPWSSGGVEARVRATAEIAQAHGHPEVDGSCWRAECPSSSWAPGAAIKAVWALEHAGHVAPGTTGRYQHTLRRRFFVEGQNIARRSLQLEAAEALAIPRAGIEERLDDGSALALLSEDQQEKERLKLQGSPTYVFDHGRAMLYGNFPYGVLHATVEELLRGLGPEGSAC